jgi:hypothetical protein
MVVMKGYVRNCAHPEGSMIEVYTTEEVIECYTDYIKDGKPKERNQYLMLRTKACVRHILVSCIS